MYRTPPFRNNTLSMLAGFSNHISVDEKVNQERLTATADLAFQRASASPTKESSYASGNDTLEGYNRSSDTDSDSSNEVGRINDSIHESLYKHPSTLEQTLFATPPSETINSSSENSNDSSFVDYTTDSKLEASLNTTLYKNPNALEQTLFAATSSKIINSSSENSNGSSSVDYPRDSDSESSYGTDSERDEVDEADSDNKIKIGNQTSEVDIIRSEEMGDLRMNAFAKLKEKYLKSEPITNQDIKFLCGDQDLDSYKMWMINNDGKNLVITGVDPSLSNKVTIQITEEEENKFVSKEPIIKALNSSSDHLKNKLENLRSGLTALHEGYSDLKIDEDPPFGLKKRIYVIKNGSSIENGSSLSPLFVELGRYVENDYEEDSEHEDLSKLEDNGLATKLKSKPREMDTAEKSAATPYPQLTGPAGAKSILPRLKLRQVEEKNKR